MPKINNLLLAVAFTFTYLACQEIEAQPIWRKAKVDINDSRIKFLKLDQDNQMLWIGSESGLYRGKRDHLSNGFLMRKVFFESVNDLYIEKNNPEIIYAATNKGLFSSSNAGISFQRIFKASDELSQIITDVVKAGENIYAGTRKGLFVFNVKTNVGQRISGELGNVPIAQLNNDESYLYVATNSDLYRVNVNTAQQEKVFSLGISQSMDDGEDLLALDEILFTERIKDVQIAEEIDKGLIYLATTEGVFLSDDNGQSWDELGIIGLPVADIQSLVLVKAFHDLSPQDNPIKIWIASTKGVFEYQNDQWECLYAGLDTNHIFDLSFDNNEYIYAATNRGIFFVSVKEAFAHTEGHRKQLSDKFASLNYAAVNEYFQHEPSIRQVQEMAIDYAEVSHKKINQWRSQAQKKAWLPSVSTGLDRNSGERYHWDTTPNPDQLQKGQFVYDWDVSLSWNLSELVWNNDQTSIDSRSKLMVELREDVLDEVTRIYFERRRLQIELLTSEEIAVVDQFDREMRIAELTAIMDGFTNGKFSRYIQQQASLIKI